MAKTAHRAIEHVKQTNASQATRSMAKPASCEVTSFYEEYQDLLQQKRDLEAKLHGYSKTAMLKEQKRIRHGLVGTGDLRTLNMWIDRKAQMESERAKLVEEKTLVEARMMAIKERAMQEKRGRGINEGPTQRELIQQMVNELQAIRELLERGQSV